MHKSTITTKSGNPIILSNIFKPCSKLFDHFCPPFPFVQGSMIPEEDASNIWVLEIMGYTGAGAMSGGSIASAGLSRSNVPNHCGVGDSTIVASTEVFFVGRGDFFAGQNERISRKNNEILK